MAASGAKSKWSLSPGIPSLAFGFAPPMPALAGFIQRGDWCVFSDERWSSRRDEFFDILTTASLAGSWPIIRWQPIWSIFLLFSGRDFMIYPTEAGAKEIETCRIYEIQSLMKMKIVTPMGMSPLQGATRTLETWDFLVV